MSQRMYQGRTNNHLTWAMVDATDFATPESALSAAMTVKVYGKLKGATGVNFVTSGTGSLTNDVQHVGASATGVYTIALAKADLSDASAAWYDQYTFIMGGTGAAQQVIVEEGVLAGANVSDLSALASDIHSLLVVANSNASNALSAATANTSKLVLAASSFSDIQSALAALGDASDVASAVNEELGSRLSDILSAAQQTNSRVLLNQSRISDVQSYLVALSAATSDVHSAATAGSSKLTLAGSTLSDIQSALAAQGTASNIASVVLAAAAAAPISADVQKINTVDITGDGSGTPFGV